MFGYYYIFLIIIILKKYTWYSSINTIKCYRILKVYCNFIFEMNIKIIFNYYYIYNIYI